MNLFIKKVLFLFSCATLVLGESLELQSQECPKNKVFHGFRGCPVKCGEGPFGNEDCKFEGQLPGCYCPEGFAILKSDGECVPYSQCRKFSALSTSIFSKLSEQNSLHFCS